jgi:uncharacterized protein YdhG (YjbR/CyaY superfamily)
MPFGRPFTRPRPKPKRRSASGKLAHFAAYKKHIGFHPGPAAILAFRERLAGYRTSSGTVQFPLDGPVPLDLVKDIISFKVRVNLETARLR